MPLTYRVRFRASPKGGSPAPSDIESIDVETDLDGLPALLPTGAYILSIEDLTADQLVHWTRWPNAYRPGFGG